MQMVSMQLFFGGNYLFSSPDSIRGGYSWPEMFSRMESGLRHDYVTTTFLHLTLKRSPDSIRGGYA